MIRFKRYDNSASMGNSYVFGLNLYRYNRQLTLDLILGKRVFVIYSTHKDT